MAGRFSGRRFLSKLYNSFRGYRENFHLMFGGNLANKMDLLANDSAAPKRNIEIKALIGNDDEFQKVIDIARELTSTEGEILQQRDVFFKTREGRLKLRYLQTGKHHLVYYSRPDNAGPKLSSYRTVEVENAEDLEKILTICNGTRGIVQKKRLLFIYKNTRIHLDKVDGLGNYLEFEVMLQPEDKIEHGQEFATTLMGVFKVKEENLINCAYLDLLLKGEEKE